MQNAASSWWVPVWKGFNSTIHIKRHINVYSWYKYIGNKGNKARQDSKFGQPGLGTIRPLFNNISKTKKQPVNACAPRDSLSPSDRSGFQKCQYKT